MRIRLVTARGLSRTGKRPLSHVVGMHEFSVLATFVVIGAIYFGLFLAAEKFWMK